MTFDSASAVRRTSKRPYEARSTIALSFGSLPGGPGASGHRTRRDRRPTRYRLPARAVTTATSRRAASARTSSRSGLGASTPESTTVATAKPPHHVRCAADMIELRMGQDDRGERPQPARSQLSGDVCLGRPLVDENRSLGDLQQDRVALPDVEKRDAEPRRRLPGGWRRERQPTRRDTDGHDHAQGENATSVASANPAPDSTGHEQSTDQPDRHRETRPRRTATTRTHGRTSRSRPRTSRPAS